MVGKKRLAWVDYLRAFAMLLVVYGHQVPYWNEFFVFTSPVKLPLFFAISAFVFNEDTDLKTFFRKLLQQIIVPWLVLTVTPRLVLLPFRGLSWFGQQVWNILSGKAYWYMPCLIIAEILWFFILKNKKKAEWLVYALPIILFIAGCIANRCGVMRICMIDTALTSECYFMVGYFYRHYREKIRRVVKKQIVLIWGVLYIALGVASILLYPGKCIDVHLVQYYSYPISLSMIVIGLLLLFELGDAFLNKYPLKWLGFVGKNTLVTYIFHAGIISALNSIINKVGIHNNPFIAVLFTAISVTLSCCFSHLLHRFLPWIFGTRKKI